MDFETIVDSRIDIIYDTVYDMETGDPDDYFTLLILASHPRSNLRAVTINPGTRMQVGFVKIMLEKMNMKIPVGAKDPNHSKNCISAGLYKKVCPEMIEMDPDGLAYEIIADTLNKYPDLTFVTGGALSNLSKFLQVFPEAIIKRWVGQGGFAGDNVVPKEYRLPQFDGKITCPTFNFAADINAAEFVLSCNRIEKKVCCSKNICHSVVYDDKIHSEVAKVVQNVGSGLDLLYDGMSIYMKKRPSKKFHDPVAALCAIDESICIYEQVLIEREKGKWGGEWGSKLDQHSNTWISVAIDMKKFFQTLLECK